MREVEEEEKEGKKSKRKDINEGRRLSEKRKKTEEYIVKWKKIENRKKNWSLVKSKQRK